MRIRRLIFGSLFAFAAFAAAIESSPPPVRADKTILQLPTASPGPSDVIPFVHNGTTSQTTIGSLQSYGATVTVPVACNGAAGSDDGPAINMAIVMVSATDTGGTVKIPYLNSGLCAIGTPIITASNVKLEGATRSVTLIRKTGVTYTAMLLNGPESAISPYYSGAYQPSLRALTFPDLVGSTAQVYDWSVSNNWYNSGQTIENLTFDGNAADTTGHVTYGIFFVGAAHFTHEHITFQNFTSGGQTDSIWYGSHFLVDDIDNINVYQGPSVQLASYDFTVSHIRTIGYRDSGVACIGYGGYIDGGSSGPNLPYTTPYNGNWSDIFVDGLGTGPIGFDHASCLGQNISNFHSKNVTNLGLSIHEWVGIPGGYVNGSNITVENTGSGAGGGGVRISEPNVHLTNIIATNNYGSGISIIGDKVSNGSGGYQDAQVADIDLVNPVAQGTTSGFGLTMDSEPFSGFNGTVKRVTLEGGTLGDPSLTQSGSMFIDQLAGSGTIANIQVIGTVVRPGSAGTGINWGGVTSYTYVPAPSDAVAGDYAQFGSVTVVAPTVATSASPHQASDILQFQTSDFSGSSATTNAVDLQAANGTLYCVSSCAGLALGNTSLNQTGLTFNSSGDTWSLATSSSAFNLGPSGTTTGTFNLRTNGQSNAATFSVTAAGNATALGTIAGSSIIVPGTNASASTAYQMPNASTASGSGHFTIFGTAAGSSVGGGPISPTVFGIADYGAGTGYGLGMDQNSNVGVAGKIVSIGCVVPGNGTTSGTAEFCSGTGAPTFSAPNGSTYMRYDGGAGTRFYVNTSGASTSGTTWTAEY